MLRGGEDVDPADGMRPDGAPAGRKRTAVFYPQKIIGGRGEDPFEGLSPGSRKGEPAAQSAPEFFLIDFLKRRHRTFSIFSQGQDPRALRQMVEISCLRTKAEIRDDPQFFQLENASPGKIFGTAACHVQRKLQDQVCAGF